MIKQCSYCEAKIDTLEDEFEKQGKRYSCFLCAEEFFNDLEDLDLRDWTEELDQNN